MLDGVVVWFINACVTTYDPFEACLSSSCIEISLSIPLTLTPVCSIVSKDPYRDAAVNVSEQILIPQGFAKSHSRDARLTVRPMHV